MQAEHDVIVVGGSVAGCTAAILYARRGLRVAVVERHSSAGHFKKLCTHYIQACATPTLARLGLTEKIEAAGGVRNLGDLWTREWGWQRHSQMAEGFAPHGYNIRREVLDPMLREEAQRTPGIELILGATVEKLLIEQDRVVGVSIAQGEGRRELRAPLVVAADGRHSTMAEQAQVPTRRTPNNRFAYFAYYRGLKFPAGTRSRLWLSMPDVAYAFPNDADTTVMVCMPHKSRREAWKSDPETLLQQTFTHLPEAPDLRGAERVSPLYGIQDLPNVRRVAAHRGMALIGDAAQASDPLWGVGCGWALQSAEWLVDCTADALLARHGLDAALTRYRRMHRAKLAGHEFLLSDFASGRPFNPIERLIYSSAARDVRMSSHVWSFATRQIGPLRFLAPHILLRALWINLRHLFSRGATPLPQTG